ncbi:toll/interleukin-1 receptor domain-containing protein [Leptospira sp. WS39.C2]
MYNLFVTSNDEDWEGNPFIMDVNRYLEYTDRDIENKFIKLNDEIKNEVKRYPTIFAYENRCQLNPKFGLIREIISKPKEIKIEYEIIKLPNFLNYQELNDYSFELDIGKWELNRTHWAIKDVNLSRELHNFRIELPYGISRDSKSVNISKHSFEVAFSFPGDIRKNVESIAFELEKLIGPNSYFYDNNYKAQLAQPRLDILLQDIYRNRSKLIVVFLSHEYQKKEWCGIEFRAIQEIIMEKLNNKIMFIKMDDGKVDGVFKTDGYIDGRTHTSLEIAKLIKERVDLF